MLNNGFVSLNELIEAAKEAEKNLWDDIQGALKKTQSAKIFTSLQDFLTTSAFTDVGDSIQAYFEGTSRQYDAVEDKDKFLDNMFISFQDNIKRALRSHEVQEDIINSFLSKPDLFNNYKSGYTGRFTDGKSIKGGAQSLIEEIKAEAMRVAWTSQFPEFDFKIEPWGSRANSTDVLVKIKYTGPRGGSHSFTFYEDVKSRLDGLPVASGNMNFNDELYKELTSRPKYKYLDGTYIVSIEGSKIEQLAAAIVGKKVGRSEKRLNGRVVYSDSSGGTILLSELLASPDLEARIISYYTKDYRKKIGITLLSGYGKRK